MLERSFVPVGLIRRLDLVHLEVHSFSLHSHYILTVALLFLRAPNGFIATNNSARLPDLLDTKVNKNESGKKNSTNFWYTSSDTDILTSTTMTTQMAFSIGSMHNDGSTS
jgi:hypothetical protein